MGFAIAQILDLYIKWHKTIFCLKTTKEELYDICNWIQKGPLNYATFDTLKNQVLPFNMYSWEILIVRYDYINVVKRQIYRKKCC